MQAVEDCSCKLRVALLEILDSDIVAGLNIHSLILFSENTLPHDSNRPFPQAHKKKCVN